MNLSPSSGGSWASSTLALQLFPARVVSPVAMVLSTLPLRLHLRDVAPAWPAINVGGLPGVTIDYNGSICLTDTSKLKAIIISGNAPFSYSWTGPSSFKQSGHHCPVQPMATTTSESPINTSVRQPPLALFTKIRACNCFARPIFVKDKVLI